jgi:hypothetical protein
MFLSDFFICKVAAVSDNGKRGEGEHLYEVNPYFGLKSVHQNQAAL